MFGQADDDGGSQVILGVFTGTEATGGLDRVSRHAAAVLWSTAEERGVKCVILALKDTDHERWLTVAGRFVQIRGYSKRKVPFVLAVLSHVRAASVVYFGHSNVGSLGLVLRILNRNARYYVVVHGVECWLRLPFIRRLSLRLATRVVAVSNFTGGKAVECQGVRPNKLVIIPPAVDPVFQCLAETQTSCIARTKRVLQVLTVARLDASERDKGVDLLILALPTVKKVVPNSRLVIAGQGDDTPRLKALAKHLNVQNDVDFVGYQSDEQLSGHYERCDVFALPSRKEGFGVVFLEAMSRGKPVVGGNHGGTPDVVREGINGFLVEHGDVAQLASVLIRLLISQTLRSRLGCAGFRMAREQFSFGVFSCLLRSLINGHP